VKVRGDGIEFDMGRAAFRIGSSGASAAAGLWLDGLEQPR